MLFKGSTLHILNFTDQRLEYGQRLLLSSDQNLLRAFLQLLAYGIDAIKSGKKFNYDQRFRKVGN